MFKGKNKWRNIALAVAGVVGAGLLIGGIAALIARNNDKDKTETLNGWDMQTCLLDNLTGKKDEEDNGGISTKDYYKLSELVSIEVDGDSDVEYYVNVYNEDKEFMSVNKYTGNLATSEIDGFRAQGGEYFKVEIVDPENEEVNFFEKFSLSNKVEITLGEAEEESEDTSEAA